jgi:hypothetical protein
MYVWRYGRTYAGQFSHILYALGPNPHTFLMTLFL